MANKSSSSYPDTIGFTRRAFVQAGIAARATIAIGLPRSAKSVNVSPGMITVTKGRRVAVHTYTAPEVGWLVNSHIIELPKQLLIVDAQYLLPCGRELAHYTK